MTRLGPPSTLSEGERTVWERTINNKPADWFGLEHLPALVNYCRHVVKADVIDAQIKAFDPAWLAEDEGLKRYERLLKMAQAESAALLKLGTSMRLTQHSIYRADKVRMTIAGRKPWQMDEQEQEKLTG